MTSSLANQVHPVLSPKSFAACLAYLKQLETAYGDVLVNGIYLYNPEADLPQGHIAPSRIMLVGNTVMRRQYSRFCHYVEHTVSWGLAVYLPTIELNLCSFLQDDTARWVCDRLYVFADARDDPEEERGMWLRVSLPFDHLLELLIRARRRDRNT